MLATVQHIKTDLIASLIGFLSVTVILEAFSNYLDQDGALSSVKGTKEWLFLVNEHLYVVFILLVLEGEFTLTHLCRHCMNRSVILF